MTEHWAADLPDPERRAALVHLGVLTGLEEAPEAAVEEGFPPVAVVRLQEALGVTREQILRALHMTRYAWRRARQEGRLSPDQSRRLFQMAVAYAVALKAVGGSRDSLRRWLRTPLPGLGGRTPLSVLDQDDGPEAVYTLASRSLYGVYM